MHMFVVFKCDEISLLTNTEYWNAVHLMTKYTCSLNALVDLSLQVILINTLFILRSVDTSLIIQVDDFPQPQTVGLQWEFDDVSPLTSPRIPAVLPYQKQFLYSDLPSMGTNVSFTIHLQHKMCRISITKCISGKFIWYTWTLHALLLLFL